ncbi:peroxidase 45-like [Durio zibethinus]|uniref:Peroxidase n=1 Tax=Durio zibethinus TaxID=66656 RepID=A0A6P5XKR6_DURZI|nr:peroxidase 45-like [Durio zibethinus]
MKFFAIKLLESLHHGKQSRIVISFIILPLLLFTTISAQTTLLRPDFYATTCPNVESIVRSAVQTKFQQTFVTAPGTLRLFFHDCFVRVRFYSFCHFWGCDAVRSRDLSFESVRFRDSDIHPSDVLDQPDRHGLYFCEILSTLAPLTSRFCHTKGTSQDENDVNPFILHEIKAKAALDSNPQCRNKVSCADILALATRDVIQLTEGPFYKVELGRRDGRISTKASVQNQLPHPNFNLDQLNSMFARHGLTQTDMIALSGAHTIGFSHCGRFSNRIYNFSPRNRIDPSLNSAYALQLRQMCPINVDPRTAIDMDPMTPRTFDNAYFKNLQQGMGLFTSDQTLFTDPRSRSTVNLFASSNAAFQNAFVTAVTKLGQVGVLAGNKGEIRRDCTQPN